MEKVLVTGANGLVGSALIRTLLTQGYFVYATHHTESINVSHPNLIYMQADLGSSNSVTGWPVVDYIVHLAQSMKFREFPASASEVYNVNTRSTFDLLQHASVTNVKRFVFASTGGVYASSEGPITESSPIRSLHDIDFYYGTKLAGEALVSSFQSEFPVTILRPFFIFGPGQNKTMLIPRLILAIKSGDSVSLSGENGISINPIFSEDAALAISGTLNSEPSNILNVCGPLTISLRDLCSMIGNSLGVEPLFTYAEAKADLVADHRHCSELIGVNSTALELGIEKTVHFLLEK